MLVPWGCPNKGPQTEGREGPKSRRLEAGGPKSRCPHSWFLPEALGEPVLSLPPNSWWLPSPTGAPGLGDTSPVSASIFTQPPPVSLGPLLSLLGTRTAAFRAHPQSGMTSSQYPYLITPAKTHFPNKATFTGTRMWTYHLGTQSNPSELGVSLGWDFTAGWVRAGLSLTRI